MPAIPLPAAPAGKGGTLKTLSDARAYILALPPADQALVPWQTATEALLLSAHGDPMLARIGMIRALYPQPANIFRDARRKRRFAKITRLPARRDAK